MGGEELTRTLREEHEVVLEVLAKLGRAVDSFDPAALHEVLRFFDETLPGHRTKEEDVLFPALAREIGEGGPIAVMVFEHGEEKRYLDRLRAAMRTSGPAGRAEVAEAARDLVVHLEDHIVKENEVVYPLAEERIPPAQRPKLVAGMQAIDDRRAGSA